MAAGKDLRATPARLSSPFPFRTGETGVPPPGLPRAGRCQLGQRGQGPTGTPLFCGKGTGFPLAGCPRVPGKMTAIPAHPARRAPSPESAPSVTLARRVALVILPGRPCGRSLAAGGRRLPLPGVRARPSRSPGMWGGGRGRGTVARPACPGSPGRFGCSARAFPCQLLLLLPEAGRLLSVAGDKRCRLSGLGGEGRRVPQTPSDMSSSPAPSPLLFSLALPRPLSPGRRRRGGA